MPQSMDDKIRSKAVAAARKRKKPETKLKWAEAVAEAPWVPTPENGPWERGFRVAYASTLRQRFPGLVSDPTKRGGVSDGGETLLIEKKFRTTPEELAVHAQKMEKAGEKSWNNWARKKLLE